MDFFLFQVKIPPPRHVLDIVEDTETQKKGGLLENEEQWGRGLVHWLSPFGMCLCYKSFSVCNGMDKLERLSLSNIFSVVEYMRVGHRYRRRKIDCSSLFTVPATSAVQNSLLFFFFLLRQLTKLTFITRQAVRAIKQSIFLRCLWGRAKSIKLVYIGDVCTR